MNPPEKELEILTDEKIRLSKQDLRIIDIYSKKNPEDIMPQFGNPDYEFIDVSNTAQGFRRANNSFFE
ncbi:hypothetical protein Cst_c23840 [Thermoclostridium stercorarium subsp. stercorarium DSM 8532]|uniref:Uncharacterized protein n=3 Tax=Thermoclostridium stercorarium TaxID=1510 RepID=L7VRS2_THES1|nr:hypothetical protein Cst_c23840 [Thermoclostridium stercorarium subsp. stercorarium DSM 8532]ANW99604.1 hypothetical protein CSTERTH_11450 [Thermoclostridium stercorarium subsp. thermolacticum DSM 2910]ANX02231.1 hypothetical protein CSTERLE_11950 [Thermoclostridium stercorarium subsp. leptospartum DSM 9219]